MRLIVPLRAVAQGKRGLFLGFAIPCALLLFLPQFLKRYRRRPSGGQHQESSSTAATSSVSTSTISSRASSLLNPADLLYNAGETTNDKIQLGLVENQLSVNLVQDWIAKHLKQLDSHDLNVHEIVSYQPFHGLMKLKAVVARVMDEAMQPEVRFIPSQIVLTAGATPAIEILSFCLADPGNAFLVPSPYYPGFVRDIKWRSGVKIVPVHCRSTDNFNLSTDALEIAYRSAKTRRLKVCAVLISNPSNPVGNLLAPQTMESLLEFVRKKNIHLISDEVSAGSVHADNEFKSFIDIARSKAFDMTRVHVVYGLSKDLSLPGFRVGVIYSYNHKVLETAKRLARFSSISIPAQHLLVTMLSDTQFIKDFIQMNKRRLGEAYAAFVNELRRLGIECAETKAGFHCWANMSKLMRYFSPEGELALWHKLQNVPKINIIPGSLCSCVEPGWFRCCFAALAENDIPMVLDHIRNVTNQ